MNTDAINNEEFRHALFDYYYLRNNHYPEKGSVKLVGDRYKLSTELRTVLYRGICASDKAKQRKKKITNSPEKTLSIDGYNVLFTLLNYRLGRFVFISNDGICRDAGSLFGKIRKEILFKECASLLIEYLSYYRNTSTTVYLDSPVSFSKKHQSLLLQLSAETNTKLEVQVVESADQYLLQSSAKVLATSDSVIIDNSDKPILDIPRNIIEEKYKYNMVDLGALL